MSVIAADAHADQVESLDQRVREAVRREGVDPQRDASVVRRLAERVVRAHDERSLTGAVASVTDVDSMVGELVARVSGCLSTTTRPSRRCGSTTFAGEFLSEEIVAAVTAGAHGDKNRPPALPPRRLPRDAGSEGRRDHDAQRNTQADPPAPGTGAEVSSASRDEPPPLVVASDAPARGALTARS